MKQSDKRASLTLLTVDATTAFDSSSNSGSNAPAIGPSRGNLAAVARLGQSIQQVRDGAEQVDLSALNAMLASQRAREGGRGFRSVATQMRTFSSDLTSAMAAMAALVSSVSDDVALLSKSLRVERLFVRATVEHHAPLATALLANQTRANESRRERLRQKRRMLQQRVHLVLKLCGRGNALARCALIEAAQTGAMSRTLTLVAIDLADALADISRSLKDMRFGLGQVNA